jgi:hypothetical protein
MHKLTVTLSNHPSPLEEAIFEGRKIVIIEVEDPHDPEDILNKLEPIVIEIRGDNKSAITVRAITDSGNLVLEGTIREGFHGVLMS